MSDIEWGIDWTSRKSLEEACGKPLPTIPEKFKPLPPIQRHQFMAYHCLGDVAFHRKERIKILWPQFQWHRWADRMLESVTKYHWTTWMGASATGKTSCAAIFATEYWLEAPMRTAVIVCSTTMKMLRMRIWNQVTHWHQSLPKGIGPVGDLLDSVTRIRWKQGDDKNGIFGIAVEEGAIEQVVNDLIGIHTERVMLIIDEGQGIREAILRATFNMAKNPRFDCLIMGNPDSLHSPLVRESEPLDGWDSIVRGETESWDTRGGAVPGNGTCQFFDGRKSPADDSPEERKRLPWLINKDWVANHLKSVKGNLNDPTFWAQAVGFPPPMGLESTLLDDAILLTFHCRDKAVWTEGYVRCAALDPAFNGGDKAILQFGKRGRSSGIGYDSDSRTWSTTVGNSAWVIEFDESIQLPINAESSRPIHYQLLDAIKFECNKRGVRPAEFAIDSSGEGGGLRDILLREWGPVNGIEAGGSPSERVANEAGRTAKETYDTRASELLFNLREFAMANAIRGLGNKAAFQAISRRTFYRNGKWAAEAKVSSKGRIDEKGRPIRGYKSRMGHSPDELDSCCILVEHCMQQGAAPGIFGTALSKPSEEGLQGDYDEFASKNYLRPYDYSRAV